MERGNDTAESDALKPSASLESGEQHHGHMSLLTAIECLSGRALETIPTPGRYLPRSAIPPYDYQYIPPDPSRPIAAPAEQKRAVRALMDAFSFGSAELRYRHPDDPLRWRTADPEGLSPAQFNMLKSELVIGESRFAAAVLVHEQRDPSVASAANSSSIASPPAESGVGDRPNEPSHRSRGPRPVVGPRVEAAMRADLQKGEITATELRDMKQVEMQVRYQASAEICRTVRDRVLMNSAADDLR